MGLEESARAVHKCGYNCSMSVYSAYAKKLGISEEEARKIAPKPRAEGGQCGAFLAGKKILEQLKPEAIPEYEKRFVELNGHTECGKLLMSHKKLKKSCNDFVGDASRLVEELLGE